ncbi:hypothetical protein A1O1_04599 [Capronia coronata CBS 617.96]|uniref:Seipin n=1 Tax=Capronia coronata CBS 617.96 TaxID=1182541 RepID=W9YDC1_9EURO|nr:uncharacterized protein A1O1_04599 [Capronia coronata CBS 617.96]EXJ87675.1 hypothetical protein A1O1_04599 [Capronia coronata CBS 617.96]
MAAEFADPDDEQYDSLLQRALTLLLAPVRILTSRTAVKAYLSTFLFLTASTILITVSSTAYGLFYYKYIPQINLERELYLQYIDGAYPYAITALDTSALVSQQAYDVELIVNMPRTPVNLEAGNFMLDLSLLGPGVNAKNLPNSVTSWLTNITSDNVRYHSRRPAILPYSSPILSISHTFLHLPWHLLNLRDLDASHLVVPMFEKLSFPRGTRHIPTHARLELQSTTVLQVYDVKLAFRAKFQGLRYLIYNYRITAFMIFTAAFYTVSVATMALAWAAISTLISPGEKQSQKMQNLKQQGQIKAEPESASAATVKMEDDAESSTHGLSLSNLSDTATHFPTLKGQPGLSFSSRNPLPESGVGTGEDDSLAQVIGPGEAADDEDEIAEAEEIRGRPFEGDSGIGTSMESEHASSALFRRRSSRGGTYKRV